MTSNEHIPLCRTEFLQDMTIELGRRFTPLRNPWRYFRVGVDSCDHEGRSLERLTVRAITCHGTGVNLTLWEDGTVWVIVIVWAADNSVEYRVGFYPRCEGFTPASVAEAFRDTVSVSTRLCYAESPLPVLRKIWQYAGEVQTKGTLKKRTKAQPASAPAVG
jgi:hypothetical protein